MAGREKGTGNFYFHHTGLILIDFGGLLLIVKPSKFRKFTFAVVKYYAESSVADSNQTGYYRRINYRDGYYVICEPFQ